MSTMTTSEVAEAQRQQWLADRRKAITSTDVSVLFGEGYSGSSPTLLYANKKGLAPEFEGNEKMEWGLLLEDDIAEMYRRQTGAPVRMTDPFKLTHYPKETRFATTLDGWDAEGWLLEFKNTELYLKDEADLFMGWKIQAQWQMLCTTQTRMRIVACVRGCRLIVFEQEADKEFQARAMSKAHDFLECLDSGVPPKPVVADDNEAMKYLYPVADEGSVVQINDPDLESVLESRKALAGEIAELTKQKRLYDATAKDYMGTAETAILPDGGKVTWKADKNGKRTIRHYKARS